MKRILITGAGSYVGTSLMAYLAQWPERYQVEERSVRGSQWEHESFRGFDAVFHVAGLVHQPQSKSDPAQAEVYDRVNARLAVEVARKARDEGVGQFIFMSSASVYGLCAPLGQVITITADTPLNPTDNYGRSKAKAEAGLRALADGRFRVAILRPPMIYGKGCKGNYQTLARMARRLPAFPRVENRRSMLYIDNLSEFVRLVVEDGAEGIFCPQNDAYVNTCDLAAAVARAHGRHLVMVPGLGWALKLARKFTGAVDKAFGSLCYDHALSAYPINYCVKDFAASIQESEAE